MSVGRTGSKGGGVADNNVVYEIRSSNTILVSGDRGKAIAATAAFEQTLTAAATLSDGWWCIVRNDTTDGTSVLTLNPDAAETVDGLAILTMYSGDTRLLLCDGSGFFTQLLQGGHALFTGIETFTAPSRMTLVQYDLWGAGGDGGNGASGSAGTARPGGTGGGGGAHSHGIVRGEVFTPGTAYTARVFNGTAEFLDGQAYHGGDGANGVASANRSGGSGGGVGEFGAPGGSSSNPGGGHISPAQIISDLSQAAAKIIGVGQGGCGADSQLAALGLGADWGGGSGGGNSGTGSLSSTARKGGTSNRGGGGGAAGGGVTTGNAADAGAEGGFSGYFTATGGNGGGAGGAATGAAGSNGDNGDNTASGCGGGGGGGNSAGTGGAGGDGGVPSGGGGGGGGGLTGGTGGTGGRGEVRIFYS